MTVKNKIHVGNESNQMDPFHISERLTVKNVHFGNEFNQMNPFPVSEGGGLGVMETELVNHEDPPHCMKLGTKQKQKRIQN